MNAKYDESATRYDEDQISPGLIARAGLRESKHIVRQLATSQGSLGIREQRIGGEFARFARSENPLWFPFTANVEKIAREFGIARRSRNNYLILKTLWRRERDSNPRYPFEHNGFQDRRFQPLTHPSAGAGPIQFTVQPQRQAQTPPTQRAGEP